MAGALLGVCQVGGGQTCPLEMLNISLTQQRVHSKAGHGIQAIIFCTFLSFGWILHCSHQGVPMEDSTKGPWKAKVFETKQTGPS